MTYNYHKARIEHSDDERYRRMKEDLEHSLNYAMKHHGMCSEEAYRLLLNPEEGFEWLQNNG